MNIGNKNKNFGQKGVNDRAVSLADSLLSGKPLARARKRDATPRLKPRPKPVFGRRAQDEVFDGSARPRVPWALGFAVGVVCMALMVNLLAAS